MVWEQVAMTKQFFVACSTVPLFLLSKAPSNAIQETDVWSSIVSGVPVSAWGSGLLVTSLSARLRLNVTLNPPNEL